MNTQHDTPRALEAAMMYGHIHSVDGKFCRVKSGDVVTDVVPWFATRAGNTRTWSAPSEGEQVLLLCPGGDTHGAVALLGLYSDENEPPSTNPDEHVTVYPDGARVDYNHATHKMRVVLPDGGAIAITADILKIVSNVEIVGGVEIDGDVTINGNGNATGSFTAGQDVVGGGISLKNHKHAGVQTGGGLTGIPQ